MASLRMVKKGVTALSHDILLSSRTACAAMEGVLHADAEASACTDLCLIQHLHPKTPVAWGSTSRAGYCSAQGLMLALLAAEIAV